MNTAGVWGAFFIVAQQLCMLSLGALLTKYSLGVMSNLSNHSNGSGNNHNSAAEGMVERGRYVCTNSHISFLSIYNIIVFE